jgi:hypothetical protein
MDIILFTKRIHINSYKNKVAEGRQGTFVPVQSMKAYRDGSECVALLVLELGTRVRGFSIRLRLLQPKEESCLPIS